MSGDSNLVWFSIEIFDGKFRASEWNDIYSQSLFEQAFLNGAQEWAIQRHLHGVVLEFGFRDRKCWEHFCESLLAKRAFAAVPDPVTGLIIHEGRGGPGWKNEPRKPRPLIGAGAAALPLPLPLPYEAFDVYNSAVEARFLRNVMSNN
jgi:hypothetical protein